MSYTNLLIDTCDIERYTEGAQDAYGKPSLTWAAHLSSEACRLQEIAAKEIKVGADLIVADYKLFLGDVDVTEQDRVTISSILYEIIRVADRQDGIGSHHKECYLKVSR